MDNFINQDGNTANTENEVGRTAFGPSSFFIPLVLPLTLSVTVDQDSEFEPITSEVMRGKAKYLRRLGVKRRYVNQALKVKSQTKIFCLLIVITQSANLMIRDAAKLSG